MQQNPRFVWNIGSIKETFPDMPEQGECVLWDRQEQEPVLTIHSDYTNAFCLELDTNPREFPFTNLENWFNRLSDAELESEGMTPSKPVYK